MKKRIIKLSVATVLVMVLAFSLMGAKATGINANASQLDECNYNTVKITDGIGIAPVQSSPYIEIRFSRFAIDTNHVNFNDLRSWLEISWHNHFSLELHLMGTAFCRHCMFTVLTRDDYFSFIIDASIFYAQFGWHDFTHWQTFTTSWFIHFVGFGMGVESFSAVGIRYWLDDADGDFLGIIAELLSTIENLHSHISSLQSQLSNANSLLNSANTNVANLTNTVNNLTAELQAINEHLQNALSLISELEADNEGLTSEIEGLNKVVAGLESDIADLESEIAYLEGVIEGLNNGNGQNDNDNNNNDENENFTTARILVAVLGLLFLILIISFICGLAKRKKRY